MLKTIIVLNMSLTTPMSSSTPKRELRCRCGCLLAKVSTPLRVSFDGAAADGIEIRCRRCKAHALLVPVDHDELRGAE